MNNELKELVLSDLKRYGYKSEKDMSFSVKKELYGYRFTKHLRKAKYYKEHNKKIRFLFNRIILSRYTEKFGFSISYGTNIGKGFYLGHIGSIVVNSETIIGNNVNLSQGVTIGIAHGGKKSGVPIIGNNVWIGANATIVGGIKIGDDVMIAPNTFVNFDVPSHSVVIFSKANIIAKENATEKYIENIV